MLYPKAPIAEAIIDLRVEWPREASAEALQGLAKKFSGAFPVAKKIHAVQMMARIKDGEDSQFSQADDIVGIRLSNAENSRVVQFQKAGFTYSHLPPYTSWETFSGEGGPLWEAYIQSAGVENVIRTAVRFINRFRAPTPLAGIGDYVKVLPLVPESLPGSTTQYAMQFVRKLLIAPDSSAVIRCGASEVEKGVTEFLLDFDVFINAQVKAGSPVPWEWLGLLRETKNKLFEEVITDRTRALLY